jgi:hypothetical protein
MPLASFGIGGAIVECAPKISESVWLVYYPVTDCGRAFLRHAVAAAATSSHNANSGCRT